MTRSKNLPNSRSVPALQRFWRNVGMQPKDSCWAWRSSRSTAGYGHFKVGGRVTLAHRYSYELHKGSIPEGLQVMHACDNPACVNPAHLSVGTAAANAQDKMAKGRHVSRLGVYTSTRKEAQQAREAAAKQRAGMVCVKKGRKPVWLLKNKETAS